MFINQAGVIASPCGNQRALSARRWQCRC